MTWFKVDDSLFSHPKVVGIPRGARPRAMGLWVLAGAWSARYLTDGFIPEDLIGQLGSTERDADALVASGLWSASVGGFLFEDWADWQPTRAEVKADREATRERVRRFRERKRAGQGTENESVTPDVTSYDDVARNGCNTPPRNARPVPTRPDPSLTSSSVVSHSPVGRARDDGPDINRIAKTLGGDLGWARRVAADILGRAHAPADPTRYVMTAIEREPDRYRPTATPPRVADLCEHGRDGRTCPHCPRSTR